MLGKSTKEPDTKRARGPSEAANGDSVISKDTRIVGDCSTEGHVSIHGTVSGNVTARSLELTSTGSVGGDIVAAESGAQDRVFVIDGAVEGAVRATHVEIRRKGTVTGGVVADDAVVHGRVKGGIVARSRLALEVTARVEGDVRALRLALKEGGQVNGTIQMGEHATTGLAEESGTPVEASEGDAPERVRGLG